MENFNKRSARQISTLSRILDNNLAHYVLFLGGGKFKRRHIILRRITSIIDYEYNLEKNMMYLTCQ